MMGRRVVLDTNVVVSGILFPSSTPGKALRKAQTGEILTSNPTRTELIEVLERPHFDRYVSIDLRRVIAAAYLNACESVEITFPIRACRDPRDDKFLELAVHGQADVIVTGDQDLLDLHPFHDIAILSPAVFIESP